MGKAIHLELCKRVKFGHVDKWYIHKPKSGIEKEKSHGILWGFDKQTNEKNSSDKTRVRIDEREEKNLLSCGKAGYRVGIKERETTDKTERK